MKNLAEKQHNPIPPSWVDALLDEPFNRFASIQIDKWLQYVELEFWGVK